MTKIEKIEQKSVSKRESYHLSIHFYLTILQRENFTYKHYLPYNTYWESIGLHNLQLLVTQNMILYK